MNRADADHHAGSRSTAILLIEAVGHPQSKLQERRAGIAQCLHALAGGHLALRPLLVLRLQATAQADPVFLLPQPLDLPSPVLALALEGFVAVDLALENRHSVPPVFSPQAGGIIREPR